MEGARPAPQPSRSVRVGWELLQLAQDTASSLEGRANTLVQSETGGLIGLWVSLHTFDRGIPRSLVWTGLLLLIAATAILAALVMPRRSALARRPLPAELVLRGRPTDEADEAALISETSAALERETFRLHRGLRISVSLSVLALAFVFLGYLIEKL